MGIRRWPFVLAGAAVVALVAWLVLRGGSPDEAATATPADDPAATAPAAPRLPPVPRVAAVPETKPYKEEIITSDGIPIAPPRGDVVGQAHPHPITPQHERIYAENRLVGGIEGAMEVKDVAGMRRLLAQYRREYPEDDQELQDGYGVIADCIEHPGDVTLAAAHQFYDTQRHSPLRRFVRRVCFENAN